VTKNSQTSVLGCFFCLKEDLVSDKEVNIQELKDELADIAVFFLNSCNVLNVDLSDAIKSKLKKNDKKYPAKEIKRK